MTKVELNRLRATAVLDRVTGKHRDIYFIPPVTSDEGLAVHLAQWCEYLRNERAEKHTTAMFITSIDSVLETARIAGVLDLKLCNECWKGVGGDGQTGEEQTDADEKEVVGG